MRLHEPRDGEEVRLDDRADVTAGAELVAVEEHVVERRLRRERLEAGAVQLTRSPLGAVGLLERRVVEPLTLLPGLGRAVQRVVALDLRSSEARPSSTETLGRKTEAVSPRRRARTNRPTACAKNSGVAVAVA